MTASGKRCIIRKTTVRNGAEYFISEENMKKIVVSVLALVLAGLLLVGCAEKYEPKDFMCGDLEIELTDGFEKKVSEKHKGYYLSKTMGVYVDEWQFDDFDDPEAAAEMDVDEFAEEIVDAGNYLTTVKLEKGLTTFSYREKLGGEKYTFCAFAYKSDEAFWLVTFFTRSEAFKDMEDTIFDYAWSVEF